MFLTETHHLSNGLFSLFYGIPIISIKTCCQNGFPWMTLSVSNHSSLSADVPHKLSRQHHVSAVWKLLLVGLRWYEAYTISFQAFFIWAFKIAVDSWKFTKLLLYNLWDDWPILLFQIQMNSYSSNRNTPY